jgi:hypothetical protein
VQVGQPVGALAEPGHLIEQAVADQTAPVQLGLVVSAEVFGCGPARGPQLAQGGIQRVQLRGGRDLAHPAREERRRGLRAAASRRIPGSGFSFAMSTPSGVVTTGVPFRVQVQKCSIVPACLSASFW